MGEIYSLMLVCTEAAFCLVFRISKSVVVFLL